MNQQKNRQCDATHSHAEWPLHGRCSHDAEKQALSEGRALDGGAYIYSCTTHASRNPWEKWEPIPTTSGNPTDCGGRG